MELFINFHVLLSLFLSVLIAPLSSTLADRQTYIIHMDKAAMPSSFTTHHSWYTSILSSLSSTDIDPAEHLYTYNHVLDGFSAVLSRPQLEQLQQMPGHLATYEEKFGHGHTTRTPKFLGLKKHVGLWPAGGFGDDVIIGVLDSGIWPESDSFNDDDMSDVPSRWRGTCETGTEFNSSHCNKKLIGARSFSKGMKQEGQKVNSTDDYDSPRDYWGHGTHTSSTAAGSRVRHVDHFGYAKGTAIGMAPKARVAMYKVLFLDNLYDAAATDTLAGMDQAIEDGVDLMSLSLGFIETPFFDNPIALGAFSAMEKGIFVSCSAGNNGPHAYTILNGAPWITTVGAGTIDREFVAHVTFGDEDGWTVSIIGKSVYPEPLLVSRVPVYYGHGNRSKEVCDFYSLDPKDVQGKFIFCDFYGELGSFQQGVYELSTTGAVGAIITSDSPHYYKTRDFSLPYVVVSLKDAELIKDYILKSDNPIVNVEFQKTLLGTGPAPQVTDFSSRGPDQRSPWILKPDILAPGVDILAAWTPNRESAPIRDNYLVTDYALVSGTSMSCPHIGGIAALLKAAHREWTPAAIRSAMMTTADIINNKNGVIIDMITGVAGTPLDYGAGQVNPNKAMDPGLVYDIQAEDYINYLCAMNYTRDEIKIIIRRSNFGCEKATLDLNYPSFILILNNTNTTSNTFKRVLTNVVNSSSTYRAVVRTPPSGMIVDVEPPTISFVGLNSTAEFSLSVKIDIGDNPNSDYFGNYGYLSWHEVNGKHVVRSPIVSAIASGRHY